MTILIHLPAVERLKHAKAIGTGGLATGIQPTGGFFLSHMGQGVLLVQGQQRKEHGRWDPRTARPSAGEESVPLARHVARPARRLQAIGAQDMPGTRNGIGVTH